MIPPERLEGRDQHGRFAAGNKHGRGSPHAARLHELQTAVRQAIEPGDLAGVMGSLLAQARDGDTAAAKVLLDRVMGRPRIEQVAESIELPSIGTAEGCLEAMAEIVKAAAEQRIDTDTARQLSDLVELGRRAVETVALETRLALIEERVEEARKHGRSG